MKLRQSFYGFLFVLSVAACFLHNQIIMAATTALSVKSGECREEECSRPALDESETPGAIAEREGAKMAGDVKKHGSDEDQWKSFILYSDSRAPEDLIVNLIKSEGFSMRLEPKTGLLHFQRIGFHQAFAIAAPARASDIWAKQELCPGYGIQVLSATSSSAVVVKYCQPFTNSQGKNFTSEEYYLYDVKTATMLALWFSSTGDKSIPGPFVKPWPAVKKYANGYDIDWKFHDTTNPSLREVVMRNRYIFKFDKKSKSFQLECTDLTRFSNDAGDMCDGPANLKLIINEGR